MDWSYLLMLKPSSIHIIRGEGKASSLVSLISEREILSAKKVYNFLRRIKGAQKKV